MVNVLPDPVTPSKTWCLSPRSKALDKESIAAGWSPAGVKSLTILNFGISKL
jgi:hypothetical protein